MLSTDKDAKRLGFNLTQMEARSGDRFSATLMRLIGQELIEVAGYDYEADEAHYVITEYGHEVGGSIDKFLESEDLAAIEEEYNKYYNCKDPYNPYCECPACKEAERESMEDEQ